MYRRLGLVLCAVVLPIGLVLTSSGAASASSPSPTVTGVFRDHGPTTGGSNVVVAGTGFTSDATVAFGMVSATKVKVVSENLLIAKSPAEPAGTVDIIVTTAAGSSTPNPHDAFTFNLNAPVVKRVFPNHGRVAGGTLVLIKGQHFSKTATVDFGTVAATKVTYESNHVLLARSPAESAGTVDIIVTTSVGSSVPTPNDAFTFVTPSGSSGSTVPVVKRIFPRQGPVSGGTTVYVEGRAFAKGATVMFGTTPAASVMVKSHHIIIATSPVEPAGTVDVIVTTTGGSSTPTPKDAFNFS
jgi:large repetitive protein